jgi:hypothetical protein
MRVGPIHNYTVFVNFSLVFRQSGSFVLAEGGTMARLIFHSKG